MQCFLQGIIGNVYRPCIFGYNNLKKVGFGMKKKAAFYSGAFGRLISVILICTVLTPSLILLVSCTPLGKTGEYTYRTYTSALGTNWNPHTWETSADRAVLDYLTSPLVSILPLDTDVGSYQWSFDMAVSVKDVTAESREDIIRFGCSLPEGLGAHEVKDGYVYEITLREGLKFEDGTPITASDYVRSMELLLDPRMKNNRANTYVSGDSAIAGAEEYFSGKNTDFSSVGCYVTGDLSFRYVTESYLEYDYMLSTLGSSWLVNESLYLSGIESSGELLSTDYGTGKDTTSSFGPYRISSHQGEKELVLVRNENWYGWQKGDDGRLVSYTECAIDGAVTEQYMTTKVVISVVDSSTAKQLFTKGELSEWTPSASEYNTYRFSEALYTAGETYTMSLFFNTDRDALLAMDRAKGNVNSVVLSSDLFRKGMSLAIDRAEFCLATEGYTPQYSLLNSAYYYDIYNDPGSIYRESDAAKEAVLRLYGTSYGDGTPYATLDEAYSSINGFDLAGARECFSAACSQLVAEGVYTAGEDIRIRVAWAKGALSADDNRQVALLNSYINRAAQGSGFGRITLEPVARVTNRYSAVPAGEYAIGYGAWGGSAFYPFRALLVYMDPEYESLHEGACWSPDKELLTLDVLGEGKTMTYQEWVRALSGTGFLAREDIEVKLGVAVRLEESFLQRYYRIPLASSTTSVLLSYQVSNFTDKYTPTYGFGGMRLLKYHYDDREWSEYVRSEGGRLRYE